VVVGHFRPHLLAKAYFFFFLNKAYLHLWFKPFSLALSNQKKKTSISSYQPINQNIKGQNLSTIS